MRKAEPSDSIFREIETGNGPRILPSELSGGPWNRKHQHGGPVAGLLTHALHHLETPIPMRLARITIEMLRAVPVRPLRVETRITRAGRRLQGCVAELVHEDTTVARATALRIRTDTELGELEARGAMDPALGQPPEASPALPADVDWEWLPGFIRAVDFVSEPPTETGAPISVWTRLRCPLVEGEPTPPIVRLAALVDFASGTGNAMDYSKYTSINPDLTIHVLREPRSDWIGLRGLTQRAADGIGQSTAAIYDAEGPVANVQASLLLDRR